MHTVQDHFVNDDGEKVIGWAVVFIEHDRVGEVVAAKPRLVRQYEISEWDFIQAVNLCNKLNGGNSEAVQDIANNFEELRNDFHAASEFVKDLIEKERERG